MSPNWEALIFGDYKMVFPLTKISKKGQQQYFQPPFTREFELAGGELSSTELWEYLKQNFKFIQFRHYKAISNFNIELRVHQFLKLSEKTQANYSTNAKRLIKKADKIYTYAVSDELNSFMELIGNLLAPKIAEFTDRNLGKLRSLMLNAKAVNQGKLVGIYENDIFIGGGFFFFEEKRITYLKGVATEEAKKNGAMFGLINHVITKYSSEFDVLDFGGSNVENVAQFYRKFGAEDRTYYNYEINQLPGWYKLGKKILNK